MLDLIYPSADSRAPDTFPNRDPPFSNPDPLPPLFLTHALHTSPQRWDKGDDGNACCCRFQNLGFSLVRSRRDGCAMLRSSGCSLCTTQPSDARSMGKCLDTATCVHDAAESRVIAPRLAPQLVTTPNPLGRLPSPRTGHVGSLIWAWRQVSSR